MMRLYDCRKGWLCDGQGHDWCSEEGRRAYDSEWPFAHSGEIHVVVACAGRIATSSKTWTMYGPISIYLPFLAEQNPYPNLPLPSDLGSFCD